MGSSGAETAPAPLPPSCGARLFTSTRPRFGPGGKWFLFLASFCGAYTSGGTHVAVATRCNGVATSLEPKVGVTFLLSIIHSHMYGSLIAWTDHGEISKMLPKGKGRGRGKYCRNAVDGWGTGGAARRGTGGGDQDSGTSGRRKKKTEWIEPRAFSLFF